MTEIVPHLTKAQKALELVSSSPVRHPFSQTLSMSKNNNTNDRAIVKKIR